MTDEPTKVQLESPDLVARLRETFAREFPGVLADGVLDVDRLSELLDTKAVGSLHTSERYGLMWAGKQDAVRSLLAPSQAALRPDPTASIGFDAARNVFVEGDNFEVLKLMQKAYNDRVKLIYIDPPYNTGNDLVYSDDFADGLQAYLEFTGQLDDEGRRVSTQIDKSGRRHSRWLSMMYPRLMLARNLLTPDGILLVSIDDNELPRLQLLLEEIFGEENYSTTFIWQKKKKPSFLHANVGSLTEYVVAMTRNGDETFPFAVDVTTAGKKYPFNNAGNALGVLAFPPGSVRFAEARASYEPQNMSGGNIITRLLDHLEIDNHRNVGGFRLEGEWRYGQRKLDEILAAGDAITISKAPFRPNHEKTGGEVKKMSNLLTPLTYRVETNEDGTALLEKLLGGAYFSNPKPVGLLKTLCKAITYDDPEAIVLDFFAGSGTTAHAVALLNAEDGGRRTSISVNVPEEIEPASGARRAGFDTVSDVTLARLHRVLDESTGGLKVLRLDRSCFRQRSAGSYELDLNSVTLADPQVPDDDVVAEVLLKEGVPLSEPWVRHQLPDGLAVVSGGVAVVVARIVRAETVHAAFDLGGRVVVFLEDAFAGSDAVKANAVTNARNLGLTMKTV